MPGQETGKTRAQRIRLDYYRQPDALASFRRLAILLAIIAAGLFGLFSLLPVGDKNFNTGPLAAVHASLENDCQACHLPSFSVAIGSDAWRWNRQASVNHLEQACQTCHRAEPHFRHLLNNPMIDQDCAGCHREHQGRRHDLSWIANKQCGQCHESLEQVLLASHTPRVKSDIEKFTRESHGDFPSLQIDLGQIRFHHEQHLSPGQVLPGAKGGMRLNMLPKAWQAVYHKDGQAADDLVELACHDCHQSNSLHSSSFAGAADREVGRYLEPVKFDAHCAGCHELNYLGRTPDQLPMPHAAPWSEIEALLAAKIQTNQLRGDIQPVFESVQHDAMPGKLNPGRPPQLDTTDDDTLAWLVATVRERCQLCHHEQHLTDEAIQLAQSRATSSLIPRRWLQRGLFDHATHSRMDCGFCHIVGAGDADHSLSEDSATKGGNDHERVLIRGIDSCTGCHRPEGSPVPADLAAPDVTELLNGQPTWASDQCVMCHRYHWTRP